jgi:uncharacterized damage-inducible protein DinB
MKVSCFAVLALLVANSVVAQTNTPAAAPAAATRGPLIAHAAHLYGGVQEILLRAARTMPEEHYAFAPAESVRTFGQIVGHVADAQYSFCSAARSEKNPSLNIEKTKKTKAELTASLEAAFAYCQSAYAQLDDSSASAPVKFMGSDSPRLGVLNVNSIHTIEHYGNLVTYMRMKGLVPPTSEPEFMKSLSRK